MEMWSPSNLYRRKNNRSELPTYIENLPPISYGESNVRRIVLSHPYYIALLLFCFILISPLVYDAIDFGMDDAEEVWELRESMVSITPKRNLSGKLPISGVLSYKESVKRARNLKHEFADSSNGNIVFFSLHGRVLSTIVMANLEKQYGLLNGGDFSLSKMMHTSQSDSWGSYNSTLDSNNKNKIDLTDVTYLIRDTFTNDGSKSKSPPRMMVNIQMSDIWENNITIRWLLRKLRVIGGVSHVIMMSRNPLRTKISHIAHTRYNGILTVTDTDVPISGTDSGVGASSSSTTSALVSSLKNKQLTCEDHRYMYEIHRPDLLNMITSQYYGFKDVESYSKGIKDENNTYYKDINVLGISYEADIFSNLNVGVSKIVKFVDIGPAKIQEKNVYDSSAKTLPSPQRDTLESFQQCPLSVILFNYNEIYCVLNNTQFQWMITERQNNTSTNGVHVTYEYQMQKVEEYLEWKAINSYLNFLEDASKCREIPDFKNIQLYKQKVVKQQGTCGHGGHSEVCRGFGNLKEYMCGRLLGLSSPSCNAFTYLTTGECYLHNTEHSNNDFWEGDCESKYSFHAYLDLDSQS